MQLVAVSMDSIALTPFHVLEGLYVCFYVIWSVQAKISQKLLD